mgnify:CR=1 FL=1
MSLDPSPTPVIVVSPPPAEPPPPLQLVCGQALPPRLTIGGSATILSTSRPHNGPGGSSMPLRFYQEGTQVTVNAGPECVDGQFWWLINGQARIGRIGRNFEQVQAWVPESSNTAYFLSP